MTKFDFCVLSLPMCNCFAYILVYEGPDKGETPKTVARSNFHNKDWAVLHYGFCSARSETPKGTLGDLGVSVLLPARMVPLCRA